MSVSNDIHYLRWKMKRNHEKYLSEIVEISSNVYYICILR
jgi:hypothetical protein